MIRKLPFTMAFPSLLLMMVVMVLAWTVPAGAQPSGGGSPTSTGSITTGNGGGSFYDYTSSGDVPMDISIWGFVQAPGRYRVPSYTKLLDLISLAGGPTERARLDEVKVVHDMTIDSLITQPTSLFNLEEYQVTANPQFNPVLSPNDVIIIPGDAINQLNQILTVISDVAVVIISVVGLIFAFSRN